MKNLFYTIILLFALAPGGHALAADTQYELKVDGLACPYCAYGVEKKLKQIDGVERVDVDLDSGTVRITAKQGVELSEAQMKKLINEAGFALRSMKKSPQ